MKATVFNLCLLLVCCVLPRTIAIEAAELKTKNVIFITLDGLRWQEVFTGAEELLLNKENGGVKDTNAVRQAYWRETPEARREALMPFLWSVVAKQGQLLGNTNKGSAVRVTNGMNFSYPGYNELLCGFPDRRINSNAKRPNPNVTMLEWLNGKPAFKGKVVAFTCWDVFPYIINVDRSGLPVYADIESFQKLPKGGNNDLLRELATDSVQVFKGVLPDSFVYHAAVENLRTQKPRLMYLSFGDTDDWAHEGRYDLVLESARRADGMIKKLWETIQSMPEYKDKTTFVITVDHGRGAGKSDWKNHGAATIGADHIWLGALGPDTPALGERTNLSNYGQNQVAATVAAFLGLDYCAEVPQSGKPVGELIRK
jgi:hypothetical protein